MKLRKNAFFYFATLVFLLCVLFAIVCVFQRLGAGQEYPYLPKGLWLLGVLGLILILLGISALWSRLNVSDRLRRFPGLLRAVEALTAILLMTAGAALRLMVIRQLPMAPESDYKTYYEMASLLHQGTLLEAGVGYCDYVSMFPHVFGYPLILSWIMGIFGESLQTALLFNLALEVGCGFVVWRIARLMGGRLCGLVALAAFSFLPSGILYSNFVASEPLFTFLLLLGIWLFTLSLHDSARQDRHPWLCAMELIGMAAVLAFASFIRPMAVIFLVAAIICMLPGRKPLPALPKNDVPLGLRLTCAGWKRCALVCAVYFAFSSLFTMGAAYAVNRQLAGSGASYGYNLLVGLNLESYGGWNQEDANYLYAALEATGSAQEAQLACRDMALERLKTDPRALLNLFVHKFEVLWGNDDFGASWNILFMDQQGNLTPGREAFLYRMMDVSDLYYLTLLLGSLIFGISCFRRGPDAAYACLLLFCGTVALHLAVENQNRYHYHALPLLCIMSGVTIQFAAGMVYRAVMERLVKKREEAEAKAAEASRIQMIQQDQEERARLRAEALHAQFDMAKAIREGHIRIVATQSVQTAAEEDEEAAETVKPPKETEAAEEDKEAAETVRPPKETEAAEEAEEAAAQDETNRSEAAETSMSENHSATGVDEGAQENRSEAPLTCETESAAEEENMQEKHGDGGKKKKDKKNKEAKSREAKDKKNKETKSKEAKDKKNKATQPKKEKDKKNKEDQRKEEKGKHKGKENKKEKNKEKDRKQDGQPEKDKKKHKKEKDGKKP